MPAPVDVVSIGELLIDMVSTQMNMSLFDAPAFEPKPGGAPANVAVGVKRLGKQSAFIGKIGNDDFGYGLLRLLSSEGVDIRNLIIDREKPTTLAFVSLSDRGDPAFAFFKGAHSNLTPADLDLDLIRGAQIFHFGSVSLVDEPVRSATLEAFRAAREAGAICSYDINWRPALWPDGDPEIAIGPLRQADVIKMNEVEIKLVTGQDDPREGLGALDIPAQLIVVTLGEKGCMYRFAGQVYEQPAPRVEKVLDGTGAGDAFWAAILSGLRFPLTAEYLDKLTRRACQAGALTTTRRGAIPALPRAEELEAL